jgi:hypothetical protein
MVYKNFIKEFKNNLKNIDVLIKPINPMFSKSFIYSKSNLYNYYYNCFLDNIHIEEKFFDNIDLDDLDDLDDNFD